MTPCTQCGRCCKEEVCPIAVALNMDDTAPCSALEFDGKKHWCGLITNPVKHMTTVDLPDEKKLWLAEHLKSLMNFGLGCDAGV